MNLDKKHCKICIVGLGYVGLPLAARFSLKGYDVIGFDTDKDRIRELSISHDRNNDIDLDKLKLVHRKLKLTYSAADIKECTIFIVTVPTPINKDKTPNLKPVISSSKTIGKILKKGSIVIYESTVYPGVTDDVCTPILEKESKLVFNKDFSTGYSPERIVPGDKINTIEKIKKVVSASNPEALEIVADLYSSIIDAGIHKAPSIMVAEAAKVTENIQRDVNIALINELHQLFSAMGINTNAVIEAASTKWNFMKLTPGLVGGHCISIDPYYLIHKSKMTGYTPRIMNAARKLNDDMSNWVVENFLYFLEGKNLDKNSINVTILGYTFKENCSDIRNTKVKDLYFLLEALKVKISIWDPILTSSDKKELRSLGVNIKDKPINIELAFVCVYHKEVVQFLKSYKGTVYDYKAI
tara:strand:- start:447 stop:1682 length:1236 start_codon:yes stop_codon:yes gene_type:complete